MGHPGPGMHTAHPHAASADDAGQLTSAQLLRRHAQDLIESAERLLAQAEAELEMAYEMVSAGGEFARAAAGSGRP